MHYIPSKIPHHCDKAATYEKQVRWRLGTDSGLGLTLIVSLPLAQMTRNLNYTASIYWPSVMEWAR